METASKWGKRIIMITAVTGGAAYGALTLYNKIISEKEKQNESDKKLKNCFEIYAEIQQNCFATVSDLLCRISDIMRRELNTESITAQLKENPSNKLALWETLKITSFSSAVVSCCVSSMIAVLVRFQLSVLSAALCCQGNRMTKEREKLYLLSSCQIFEEGLAEFITAVRRAAEVVLVSYSLKHLVTTNLITTILNNIITQSASGNRSSSEYWLMRYMKPQDTVISLPGSITDLMAAIDDALEIDDTQHILTELISNTISNYTMTMTELFHSASQNSESLPLARVIPLLSDHSILFLDSQQNRHLKDVVDDFNLMSCSRNIFEAFSKGLD